MNAEIGSLRLKKLGIDTYKEAVIYIHKDCAITRTEGLSAQTRVEITLGDKNIIATLNIIHSNLLTVDEASLSNHAFELLNAKTGDLIHVAHPKHLASMGMIRSKVFGTPLDDKQMQTIINDVVAGRLSDIYIATFLSACAGNRLSKSEIISLTRSMVNAGQCLNWPQEIIVDKHCVGGLPGNRTTLIVVPIVAAFGLTIPKTSSRAITSPAGTADTMEVLAPVDLSLAAMKKVVEQENGCIVWGGSVSLSPADDVLIGVEHVLDLDSEGQLVASVLSKKIAAGSNHIVIDIPIGPSAKVRTMEAATLLKDYLEGVGDALGLVVKTLFTDGTQPVGRGIGPALEAKDVLAVLHRKPDAPQDLRDRSLTIAGSILEFSKTILPGQGKLAAQAILDSGMAWKKFQAIADAQGGLRDIPTAPFQYIMSAKKSGEITGINNRHLARIAKLAGAPREKVAGVELLVQLHSHVEKNQPLLNVYAQTRGELDYSVNYLENEPDIFTIIEK